MIALALLLATEVAVTVDDLPAHGPDTPGIARAEIASRMLAAFQRHRVPAVYGFVNGSKPENGTLAAWRAAGFPLGNHGFRHLDLNQTAPAEYLADVERNEPFTTARVFRYPFLFQGDTREKRDAVRAWLHARGYAIAHVSIDFDDWAWNPPFARCTEWRDWLALGELRRSYLDAAVVGLERARRLAQQIEGREIAQVLLLHVGAIDAELIEWVLGSYEAAGVRWVTLERALQDPIYAKDAGVVWKAGTTVLDEWARARKLEYPKDLPWPDESRLEQLCREAPLSP
jgi:peptidoglycan/xylan/chitin deacetylase (PgdA/CDA1 family)